MNYLSFEYPQEFQKINYCAYFIQTHLNLSFEQIQNIIFQFKYFKEDEEKYKIYKQQLGDLYYTFTHKKPFEEYKIRDKECYLTNYLLYAFEDKLDKLPQWMLFEEWNKLFLGDFTLLYDGTEEFLNDAPTDSYAFEIYYQRTHKMPPKEYFYKNFDEYYLNQDILNSGLYLDFDVALIKEFISEESFNRILIDQIEQEIKNLIPSSKALKDGEEPQGSSYQKQLQNCLYLNNPLYRDDIKPYIADIFNHLEEVPEEFKFDGWQQQIQQLTTNNYNCFQLYFMKFHKSPPQEFWYKNCLRDIFIYEEYLSLKMTPIMWFICVLHQLPPQEFQYKGWQYYKKLIVVKRMKPNNFDSYYHKFYISLPFLWVITTKTLLPKELQIRYWDTRKETFIIRDDDYDCNYKFIKGTILDLYEILHLTEPHTEGVCLKCLNKLENDKCPVCKQYNIYMQCDVFKFM